MKICNNCKEKKRISDVQVRLLSKDGLTACCKACLSIRDKHRYKKEKIKRSITHKKYMKTEQGISSHIASAKKWVEKNSHKRRAHNIVSAALKSGKISKSDKCQLCGQQDQNLEGHHYDYNEPLSVTWLCASCHRGWHKHNGEPANATNIAN